MTDDLISGSRHMITSRVVVDTHPRCGAIILTGHAEGLRARVDLTALNAAGEVAALIDGLATYTLLRTGLVHRDAHRITDRHLAALGPTLPAHRCGRAVPAAHRAADTATTGVLANPTDCPF